jgi:hypothetical protein
VKGAADPARCRTRRRAVEQLRPCTPSRMAESDSYP